MGAQAKQQIEAFEKDFNTLYAKGTWTPQDISQMKDLKKLIYYTKVICAMDEGDEYPGSEHMPDTRSYTRGRDPVNGRYVSRDMMPNGSGMYHHPYMDGGMYYDDMNSYSRRYYDSEKEKAIHKLHHMMENTDDPERKNALRFAINELEMK